MDNKKFSAGIGNIVAKAMIRALIIFFIGMLILVGAFGDVDGAGAVLFLAIFGSFFWEFTHQTSIEVGKDGVTVSLSGKKPEFYKFEKWYFSAEGRQTLKIEMRKLDKIEKIDLKSFPPEVFSEMTILIKKRQEAWFTSRRADAQNQPIQTTVFDAEKAASEKYDFKSRAMAAQVSAAEAAARNPYAKKSASTPKADVSPITAPAKESIPETTVGDSPKITGIPDTADLPDTSDFDKFLSQKPNESAHDHGEDFHKAVFYYPRRDIEERSERNTALKILSVLFISVALFLAIYIAAPRFVVYEGLSIGVVCVIVIGSTAGSRKSKLRGIPSKLEVTKNHFVIDNTRYRVGEMTQKTMTSPDSKTGIRVIRFGYAGKTVICQLGPCVKPSKNTDEYFGRYKELCDALSEKGFKCS